MIAVFLVNMGIVVLALYARTYTAVKQPGVWYAFGITFPIYLLMFPVAYVLCFFPEVKFFTRLWQCFSCRYFTMNHIYRWHSIQEATAPESSRVSPPTHTIEREVSNTKAVTHLSPLNSVADTENYGSCSLRGLVPLNVCSFTRMSVQCTSILLRFCKLL